MAVDVLLSKGVTEDRILFLNIIASPEGVGSFAKRFPKLRIVTAFIDQGLDEKKYVYCNASGNLLMTYASSYIVPGLGDFGDRFYTL